MDLPTEIRLAATACRPEIEEMLDQAQRDLARWRDQTAQLEQRVQVLDALLASTTTRVSASSPDLTLHEAMATVLREAVGRRMRPGDLAAEINRRSLYRMRDGRPLETGQIHARIGHYGHMFRKEGGFIVLVQDGS